MKVRLLIIFGCCLCLLQVWAPQYFLTGDGPCHVYNAQILHDLWTGKDVGFYSRFFDVLREPNPNWFTTAVLALLMFVVNGIVAEKLFLTAYILLYVTGFYCLLKKIAGGNSWWPLAVFVFVFTHALTKGFYNFSFGIAFYFWVVWCWLQYMEMKNLKSGVLFFLFVFLAFFTHLLAFSIAIGTCMTLSASYCFASDQKEIVKPVRMFIGYILRLLAFVAPFVIILVWFTAKEGGLQLQFAPHPYRLVELAQSKHLVNFNHNELLWTTIAGCTLLAGLLLCLTRFSELRRVHRFDGFLYALLVVMIIYLFFPEDLIGRAMDMSVRMQLFVLILAALVIAYRLPYEKMKNIGAWMLFGCFLVLAGLRFTCIRSASSAQADIMSAGQFIKTNSVVLPLNFATGGHDDQGRVIADWNASFRHAAQYLAVHKPLIILDNYEANTGYFPLQWKPAVNPYHFLGPFEGETPYADIAAYEQKTSVGINYILMWCYDSSYLQDECFGKLSTEISQRYHKIYSTAGDRTILYERN